MEALYGEIIPEGEADYEEDAIEGIVRRSPKAASRRSTSSTGGTSSSGGAGRTCAGS